MELKPCPFCGPRLVEPDLWENPYDSGRWQVNCGGCGGSSGNCSTRDRAITAWNQRHPDTQALVEAVRLLCEITHELSGPVEDADGELLPNLPCLSDAHAFLNAHMDIVEQAALSTLKENGSE